LTIRGGQLTGFKVLCRTLKTMMEYSGRRDFDCMLENQNQCLRRDSSKTGDHAESGFHPRPWSTKKAREKKDEGKNGKAEMRSEESKVVCIGLLCQDMARVLKVKHFYQTCMNQHDLNAWASFPGPDHGSESFVTASELDSIGWSTITYRVAELA
jgi:hypothetical protein